MSTFLETKRRDAGLDMHEVAMAEQIAFSTYRMVESGDMHVTPDMLERFSSTIDRLAAEKPAVKAAKKEAKRENRAAF